MLSLLSGNKTIKSMNFPLEGGETICKCYSEWLFFRYITKYNERKNLFHQVTAVECFPGWVNLEHVRLLL